jgi:steroid delta-isomerase-like uncharacterized protein
MSTEPNKTLVRQIPEEMFNKGNLAIADELFAPNFSQHVQFPPGWPTGVASVKQIVTMLRTAFPDFQYTIEDEIAEGDKVVMRLSARGTQLAPFMGIPATGKQATWTEIHIARIAEGKVAEHWANRDQLGLLQQLGAMPAPQPA